MKVTLYAFGQILGFSIYGFGAEIIVQECVGRSKSKTQKRLILTTIIFLMCSGHL